MEKVKVSIIIPIYNSQMYLEQCLKSAFNQTMKDIEIICVDDGSTDTSSQILDQYAEADSRIRVISQNNQGAGSARNIGLKNARGKYIAFLDSDDYYVDSDALFKMYSSCENNNVKVCGSLRKVLRNGKEFRGEVFDHVKKTISCGKTYLYKDIQCDYNYQSFIFEREMLLNNDISFPDYRRYQDPPFFVRAMYAAQTFYMADTCLYCYRTVEFPRQLNLQKTVDLVKGLVDVMDFSQKYNLDQLFITTKERFEYEYENVIFFNLKENDIILLDELIKANQLIRVKLDQPGYVISPLRKMQKCIKYEIDNYEEQVRNKLERSKRIVVYGAGNLAKKFITFINKCGYGDKIDQVVVTSCKNNDNYVFGKKIISIEQYVPGCDEQIFVAVGQNYWKEIEDIFLANKIENYEFVDVNLVNI